MSPTLASQRSAQRIEQIWLGSPVKSQRLQLSDVIDWIPSFDRREFAVVPRVEESPRANERLDAIVRRPFRDESEQVPVGVVSKKYSLVQHSEVIAAACAALTKAGLDPATLFSELRLTEYGERMMLSIYLPDAYSFDPGDGHPILLRLELWNSVEGSVRLRVLLGWFRLVCSNGLVLGVTRADVRRRHINELTPEDIGPVLKEGLREAAADRDKLAGWAGARISPDDLMPWVDGDLKKAWGFKAAARAYHIACKGLDCEVVGPYKDAKPSTVNVRVTDPVPGAPIQTRNLFDVSQILAWLAKERRDLQEQLEWREQIPGLMAALAR